MAESLCPETSDEFFQADDPGGAKPLMLAPVLSGEFFKSLVNYPVMVEMWEKRKSGRIRRAFQQAFTEAERKKIASYYSRFYRWHLISGTPAKIMIKPATIALLQRAVAFFGTI